MDYFKRVSDGQLRQRLDAFGAVCPAIRSRTTIRSGVKRSFCDPSIAVASLGLTP